MGWLGVVGVAVANYALEVTILGHGAAFISRKGFIWDKNMVI